ncbi:hypothetical protein SISSUDRAFT_1065818 [Sistotremastrum suecicum HHB10207 ss-3]|uniref:Uncharacterized protein n=1 Tax=Sistotremastrum suecicum HHB10207 ss-3 TaxID=1314776 RepID=A0A165Z126_9AGAM|nr:hypothetical protein SISSUDRAFT_1065818 [Sistotremastrum suecicum HHB10207 ss-3]
MGDADEDPPRDVGPREPPLPCYATPYRAFSVSTLSIRLGYSVNHRDLSSITTTFPFTLNLLRNHFISSGETPDYDESKEQKFSTRLGFVERLLTQPVLHTIRPIVLVNARGTIYDTSPNTISEPTPKSITKSIPTLFSFRSSPSFSSKSTPVHLTAIAIPPATKGLQPRCADDDDEKLGHAPVKKTGVVSFGKQKVNPDQVRRN